MGEESATCFCCAIIFIIVSITIGAIYDNHDSCNLEGYRFEDCEIENVNLTLFVNPFNKLVPSCHNYYLNNTIY